VGGSCEHGTEPLDSIMFGNSYVAAQLLASQEVLTSIELGMNISSQKKTLQPCTVCYCDNTF
jgi:hypothetical protein